ncbi:MAG: hypothetical protein IPG48_05175 [Saprospiraceae bacterium]|nr:hypothetical protein [Saprospiraceae bacterium]
MKIIHVKSVITIWLLLLAKISFSQCSSGGCSMCNITAQITSATGATINTGTSTLPGPVAGPGNPTASPLVVTATQCGTISLQVALSFTWDGGTSVSWLHGISFGNSGGWTAAIGVPPANSAWIFMPSGITGICSGASYGPGYYYDPPGTTCGTGGADPNQANYSSWDGMGCAGMAANGSENGGCFFMDSNYSGVINDGDPSDNWGSIVHRIVLVLDLTFLTVRQQRELRQNL